MASGLDALRKNYTELEPFERANMMLQEATTHQREAVAEALTPPTLWDAFHETRITCGLVMVAGYALAQSLKADRARCANLGIALRAQAKGKILGLDNAFDTALENTAELREIAEGWITALAKLEAETGGAFLAAAKMLDESYPGEVLERSRQRKGGPADDAEQLEALRHAWQAIGEPA